MSQSPSPQELVELRHQMDLINRQLTNLLEQRLALAQKVLRLKERHELPLHDPVREQQMLEKSLAEVAEPNHQQALRQMLESVFSCTLEFLKSSGRK